MLMNRIMFRVNDNVIDMSRIWLINLRYMVSDSVMISVSNGLKLMMGIRFTFKIKAKI